MPSSPAFHAGELRVQHLAGTRGVADELSVALATSLPVGARLDALLSNVRLLSLASVTLASAGRQHSVWVSLLFGQRSFVRAQTPEQLLVDLNGLAPQDVLHDNLRAQSDSPVGLLALDFLNRRRYRTNGVVRDCLHSDKTCAQAVLTVAVREAFSNCPKYIQTRDVTLATTSLPPVSDSDVVQTDVSLSVADKAIITAADTFFLGTYYEQTGVDVSHRGGRPGFVRVQSDTELFWPDYRGNGMFQSFGNLQVSNRAGLAFVDFATGHVVQLSGSATVEWEVDEALGVEAAAERIVRFHVDEVRRSVGPGTNYRWQMFEYSPYNPLLPGEEDSFEFESQGKGLPTTVTLVKITEESRVVKTFRFLAPMYIPFLPGQYATFDFGSMPQLGTGSANIIRTWTLSEAANSKQGDLTLEISVKRKEGGVMSNWLHDHAALGLRVKLLGVGGEMTPFDKEVLPDKLLFISGGIGITPNMAILRGIGARSDGPDHPRPDVVFVHQERFEDHVPFKKELHRRANEANGRTRLLTVISGERSNAGSVDESAGGKNVKVLSGRVGTDLLLEHVEDITSRVVYLCGPTAFMDGVTKALLSLDVPQGQIVTEQFNF